METRRDIPSQVASLFEQSSPLFLTERIPGFGGQIKTRPEDFLVDEIPLYPASGEGDHLYLQIEKRGLSTMDMLAKVANALSVPRKSIGYAGLKDSRAVTRQWISIEHMSPERVLTVDIPSIRVVKIDRHRNKLKMGHLSGNYFTIRLRKLSRPLQQAAMWAREVMEQLARVGVPNYFGPQRFGNRQDSHWLGYAVIRGRTSHFIDRFLGMPENSDMPAIREARQLYEAGDYKKALEAWPYSFHDQRRALKAMVKTSGKTKAAYHVVDKQFRKLMVSAFQSFLFNRVLDERMPEIDRLLEGDMAWKHENGACFLVDQPEKEQPRCTAFEVSPTGPLIGTRMAEVGGPAAAIEKPILDRVGLNERDYKQMGIYGGRGARRPLRFQPRRWEVKTGGDEMGEYLELRFELDPGCYATTVLRELTKREL